MMKSEAEMQVPESRDGIQRSPAGRIPLAHAGNVHGSEVLGEMLC